MVMNDDQILMLLQLDGKTAQQLFKSAMEELPNTPYYSDSWKLYTTLRDQLADLIAVEDIEPTLGHIQFCFAPRPSGMKHNANI